MIDELRAKLLAAHTGTPDTALDTAVGVYKDAACLIAALEELQKEAKALITEIFTELTTAEAVTSCGKVYVTKPSVSVTYDRKGLDALADTHPDLAAALAPYRKETLRPGVLTIR